MGTGMREERRVVEERDSTSTRKEEHPGHRSESVELGECGGEDQLLGKKTFIATLATRAESSGEGICSIREYELGYSAFLGDGEGFGTVITG